MNTFDRICQAADILRQEADKLTERAASLRALAYGLEQVALMTDPPKPSLHVVPKDGNYDNFPGRPD